MKLEEQWKLMDILKRRFYIKFELKKTLYKSLIFNKNITVILRFYALYKLSSLQKYTSITKQNNRCVISGRSYNVLSKFKYSRFVLRSETNSGNTPGFSRISW
jgi:small subunit ribosomal protein S14